MLSYIYLYKLTERRKSDSDIGEGFCVVRCNRNVVLIVEKGSDKKKENNNINISLLLCIIFFEY
jgi:hypothetical protein